jgi:hypothetical protein
MYSICLNVPTHIEYVNGKINKMSKVKIEDVLGRIKQIVGESSDSGLARALDTTPQTISSWKARDSIPYAKCIELAEKERVSLDWLLTGEGAMYKAAAANQQPSLSPRDQGLLDLFHALDEDAQREIQSAAQEKKRVRDMETQLQELSLKLERFSSSG